MPLNPILGDNNILEVVFQGEEDVSGASIVNIFHHRILSNPVVPADTLATYILTMRTKWVLFAGNNLSSSYRLNRTIGRRISDVTPRTPTAKIPRPTAIEYDLSQDENTPSFGGVAVAPLPNYVTASVWMKTGFVGRYWRGGSRISMLPRSAQDLVNPNRLLDASRTALQAAVTTFLSDTTLTFNAVARSIVFSPTFYAWEMASTGPLVDASADVLQGEVGEFFRSQLSRSAPHVP